MCERFSSSAFPIRLLRPLATPTIEFSFSTVSTAAWTYASETESSQQFSSIIASSSLARILDKSHRALTQTPAMRRKGFPSVRSDSLSMRFVLGCALTRVYMKDEEKGKMGRKKSFPSTRRSLYRVYVAKLLCWSLVVHNRHSCSFSSSSRWMILLSLLAVIRSGYPVFLPRAETQAAKVSFRGAVLHTWKATQHCRKWSLWVGAEQDRKKQRKI